MLPKDKYVYAVTPLKETHFINTYSPIQKLNIITTTLLQKPQDYVKCFTEKL